MHGLGILIKKDKYVYIGQFDHSIFNGYGAFLDLQENSIYIGHLEGSEKNGFG